MEREEYEAAQELLQELPEKDSVDKKQIQAQLYIKLGKLEDAAKIEEEKLLAATNKLHQILMTLMEIAMKEDRMEDAEYISNVCKEGARLFDLWEYSAYVAQFQLYSDCKNGRKCLKVLLPMLKAPTCKWESNRSPLYRHIQTKSFDPEFGPKMQKTLLHSMEADGDTEFLSRDEEFREILKEFDEQA